MDSGAVAHRVITLPKWWTRRETVALETLCSLPDPGPVSEIIGMSMASGTTHTG